MLKHLRQLASDSVVYGLSGVVSRFITIFLVPLYTRVLTPTDYGTMSLVRSTTTLLAMAASLALDAAAHRFYWDTDDPDARKSTLTCWASSYLVMTSLAAALVILFANGLSTRLVGTAVAAVSLRLAAATMPLNALGIVFMNRLRMQRRPWSVTAYTLTTSVLTILLTAALVLIFHMGIQGVFLAQFVVALGTAVFLVAFVRDWIHPRYFELKRLKSMVRYSVPLLPTLVGMWAVDVIDRYFLNAYGSTAQVGIYDIGYSIAAVVALGTSAFSQAWFPFAMSINREPDAKESYANAMVAYVWLGSAASVAAAVFAPEALRLLTTKAYYGADSVVACLAFSYLFMGAGTIAGLGASISKKTVSVGVAVIASAIANIGLNFWLIPPYGKDGAAWATLIASAVMPVYLFYRSQQFYHIPYRFGRPVLILAFAVVIIKLSATVSASSVWIVVLGKLALLSLFLPLLLVLKIVKVSHLRAFGQKAAAWSSRVPAAERS